MACLAPHPVRLKMIYPDLSAESEKPMSLRTSPPFRADHVGSLLRPAAAAAGAGGARGRDDNGRRAAERRGRRGPRRREDAAGRRAAVGDRRGVRRASWHMDFIYQLGGIGKAAGNLAVKFRNPSGEIEWTPAALPSVARSGWSGRSSKGTSRSSADQVGSATPKLTIPSPSMVHYRGGPAMLDASCLLGHRGVLARPVRRVRGSGPQDRRARRPLSPVR